MTGKQSLLAFARAANFSQAGAALGVFFKTKKKELKTVAASASMTALFGITEPAIYGVTLRLKSPMICAVICGAIGGGLIGWGGSYGTTFADQGVLIIAVYAETGTKAFFGSAIASYFVGFEDIIYQGVKVDENNKYVKKNRNIQKKEEIKNTYYNSKIDMNNIDILSPIEVQVIDLSKVKDEVFSSNAMGKGIGIIPLKGEVVSPENATVSVVYPTNYAVILTLDSGVEIIIHI